MKPPGFDYHRAASLDEACELLSACGEGAKILAGGQSLIPMMNFRLARPRVLIDISNIAEPNPVSEEPGGIRTRATTVQRVVENSSLVQEKLPLLSYAIRHVAHTQIRNKGTIGGSIANADPASELPAMCLALDAQFELRRHGARRTVPAAELFVTYMTTSLEADEIISSILFAEPPKRSGWGFHELARRSGDYALAGSSAVITLDGANRCTRARIALFGVAATPVRAITAEESLLGQVHSASLVKDAAHLVQGVLEPESDMHVTAAYRRSVAEVLTVRALDDAFRRALAAR
ncbi:MAG: xanthine dehydrogenase family protein subunit [Gammaproteobacteria bacterium]|nr:xanthine dehydrogenase family protein subunit [Gammaproteobacteria bacterium]